MTIQATVDAYLRRLELNRAVTLMISLRLWDALAVPASMLIIVRWMGAEEQGFYYTFQSVVALQVFVELGLSTVLVQTASHEWAFLRRGSDGHLSGDAAALSRLASLTRFALKWYGIGGMILFLGLSFGGSYFFSLTPCLMVDWQKPWIALSIATGSALTITPLLSLLEGCNQVASVYSCRLSAGVISTIVLCLGILGGCGLYAMAMAVASRSVTVLIFVLWKHRQFFFKMLTLLLVERLEWRKDVWPFQWRIAVSWLSGYFIFSIFNPVMFHYHGAIVAGQMGMTLMLVMGPYFVAIPWINSRVPQFGMLIAHKEYATLDALFHRLFLITLCINILCSVVILMLILALKTSEFTIRDRILPVLPVALLLIAWMIQTAVSAMAAYLRAHKREPMMVPSVIGAVLVGLSTWVLGASYGPTGAAAGFLANCAFFGLPVCIYVFNRCRCEWHHVQLH